jgi:hypothetical protein
MQQNSEKNLTQNSIFSENIPLRVRGIRYSQIEETAGNF